MSEFPVIRRRLLKGFAAWIATVPLTGHAYNTSLNYDFSGAAADLELNLEAPVTCTSGTRAQTEGPFYSPATPRRSTLIEPDSNGSPLVLEGLVMTPDCRPVAGAVVDIWHCDEQGRYDNQGYRYRGHQFTDGAGSYQFKTIRPTLYSGRTEHIHVKVQGENTRLLTTQIYFPDRKQENAADRIFRPELIMNLKQTVDGWYGRFDFVLQPKA